jgi:hypothetical protein
VLEVTWARAGAPVRMMSAGAASNALAASSLSSCVAGFHVRRTDFILSMPPISAHSDVLRWTPVSYYAGLAQVDECISAFHVSDVTGEPGTILAIGKLRCRLLGSSSIVAAPKSAAVTPD